MSKRIGFVMDPIAGITPNKDTTLALMLAAQKTGADIFYMVMEGLYVDAGTVFAVAQRVRVFDDHQHWFTPEAPQRMALTEYDLIVMRKDPPVDKRFLHGCAMLEQAVKDGVRVVNDPTALITLNEKLFAGDFPQYCPETLVASQREVLRDFLDRHDKIIIKPLDAMGGEGVFMVTKNDVNFDVIHEIQTLRGTYPVMAQRFIPAIDQGDSRIIMINGEAFDHVLVRTPKQGSIRGNMAAGGTTTIRKINAQEQDIATHVGAELRQRNIVFAGLDVIGDRLIEINITSPTGIRQISAHCGVDLGDRIIGAML